MSERKTMAEYLSLQAVSSGLLHRVLVECPLEAWLGSPWNPGREDDSNKATDIGIVAHACLLEGNTDCVEMIDPNNFPAEKTGNIPDGWTNKAIRAARDAARAAGKIPLFPADVAIVKTMADVAHQYVMRSEFSGVFISGAPEQTATWDEAGTLCKARPDWDNPDICLHLKTTKRSVHPSSFERLAINLGYDISLMFYARGIKREHHVILAQQQYGSFACKWFALSNAQADISMRKVERALNIWRECRLRGEYPAYSGEVHYIEPTSYQLAQAESDMLDDEELEGGMVL